MTFKAITLLDATEQHLTERMLFLWFCILPGSAESLVRWGGKIPPFECLLSQYHLCQKLPNVIHVCQSYKETKSSDIFLRHCVVSSTYSKNFFNTIRRLSITNQGTQTLVNKTANFFLYSASIKILQRHILFQKAIYTLYMDYNHMAMYTSYTITTKQKIR